MFGVGNHDLGQGYADKHLQVETKIQPPNSISTGAKTHKNQAFYDVAVPAVEKRALKPCQLTHHMDKDLLVIRHGLQTRIQWLKAKLFPNLVRHSAPLPTSVFIVIFSYSRFPHPSLK